VVLGDDPQDAPAEDVMTGTEVEKPRRIAGATAGLPASRLRDAPEPGAWSVNDVLARAGSP
jgi:hypothetical protein